MEKIDELISKPINMETKFSQVQQMIAVKILPFDEYNRIIQENIDLKKESMDLKKENSLLKGQLNDIHTHYKKITNDLELLTDQNKELRRDIKKLRKENKKLKGINISIIEDVKNLKLKEDERDKQDKIFKDMMISYEICKLYEQSIVREIISDPKKRKMGYYKITNKEVKLNTEEEKNINDLEENLKIELGMTFEDLNYYVLNTFKNDRHFATHDKHQLLEENIDTLQSIVLRFCNQSNENKELIPFTTMMMKKIKSLLGEIPFKKYNELLEKERPKFKK